MSGSPRAPASFYTRADQALHDARLRAALDHVTDAFAVRRKTAFASLDDADLIREAARAARLSAVGALASHLERFEASLVRNGAQVHWARTSDEASSIVRSIAAAKSVKRIVKSKSMVTEEIELNVVLERDGLHVVETDLGEYIVQLARDRPSHIIAPIIHMSRADVGRVMEARLGVGYTDDPGSLAAIARSRLRGEFLAADMGISGANFGVVETGTICLVTNEGNGRMVTTLPRIHIVVMGLEKLVPAMTDLGRCLEILARSATGQKLSVYTTLLNGPRRQGEADGPDEMHVILLDNGRARIRGGETAEILGCIRCGACLNTCPIYRNIGGHAYGDTYAGPIGAVLTPGLRGLGGWDELPGASTLCGACRDVCPVRLDIPRMLLALRRESGGHAQPRSIAVGMRLFAQVAVRPWLYRPLGRAMRFLLRRRARDGWVESLPGVAAGWTKFRSLKAPAAESFQDQWRRRPRQEHHS